MWCLDILRNLFSMCLFGNDASDDHKFEIWRKENNKTFNNVDNVVSLKYVSNTIGNDIKSGWLIPTETMLWSDDAKAEFVKELQKQGYKRENNCESRIRNNACIRPPFES